MILRKRDRETNANRGRRLRAALRRKVGGNRPSDDRMTKASVASGKVWQCKFHLRHRDRRRCQAFGARYINNAGE
jgi:hypothetical protein